MQQQPIRLRQMIVVDFLRSLEWRNDMIDLEVCALLLPIVNELLVSSFER